MSKTITHEGKVYEIGKWYLFSDNGENWYGMTLFQIVSENECKFRTVDGHYKYINEIPQSELGTIKDAPVELVDGEAYMFTHRMAGNGVKGIWCEDSERFHNVGWFDIVECTNIRKMVVA